MIVDSSRVSSLLERWQSALTMCHLAGITCPLRSLLRMNFGYILIQVCSLIYNNFTISRIDGSGLLIYSSDIFGLA
jgi:hypothetical protein